MNFKDVEAKDDADGLLQLSGAFGIDDRGGGGAGDGHLGFDLIAERIAGLELRKEVNARMIGSRDDRQGEQHGGLKSDAQTASESSFHVASGASC